MPNGTQGIEGLWAIVGCVKFPNSFRNFTARDFSVRVLNKGRVQKKNKKK